MEGSMKLSRVSSLQEVIQNGLTYALPKGSIYIALVERV